MGGQRETVGPRPVYAAEPDGPDGRIPVAPRAEIGLRDAARDDAAGMAADQDPAPVPEAAAAAAPARTTACGAGARQPASGAVAAAWAPLSPLEPPAFAGPAALTRAAAASPAVVITAPSRPRHSITGKG